MTAGRLDAGCGTVKIDDAPAIAPIATHTIGSDKGASFRIIGSQAVRRTSAPKATSKIIPTFAHPVRTRPMEKVRLRPIDVGAAVPQFQCSSCSASTFTTDFANVESAASVAFSSLSVA